MDNEAELPEELQPDKIKELEATCPDIVRFLRAASELGSKESDIVSTQVHRQETAGKALAEAINGRLSFGISMMLVKQLESSDFTDGIIAHVGFPDEIREFCKKYMGKNHGAHFEFKEPTK